MTDVVAVRTRRGFGMLVDLRDESFGPHVAIGRDWEPALSDLVERELIAGDTVAVAGANAGWYALLAQQHRAFVDAFEPGPAWDLLVRNVTGARLRQVAVGSAPGRVGMFVPATDAGGWPIATTSWGCARTCEGDEVEMMTLDQCGHYDVVIVDAEGDEVEVWDGAEEIRRGVRLWIAEVSPKLCDVGRLLDEMRDDGFSVTALHAERAQACEATREGLAAFTSATLIGRRT